MNTNWNPELYLRFQEERTQPAIDLVNRIEMENPDKIIDIGCGPGNSTKILRDKWPNSEILGIDNSGQMIDKAKLNYPEGNWQLADVLDLPGLNEYDIVFSNAALQWIPNHEKLIPYLLKLLKPKGIIAVQLPQNQLSILYKALNQIASEEVFKEYTQDAQKILNYQTGEYYYNLLHKKLENLYIWETTYYHIIRNHEDIVNWYQSTGMRPYLEALSTESMKTEMIERLILKCKDGYDIQSDGRIIFPFKRLFFMGQAGIKELVVKHYHASTLLSQL